MNKKILQIIQNQRNKAICRPQQNLFINSIVKSLFQIIFIFFIMKKVGKKHNYSLFQQNQKHQFNGIFISKSSKSPNRQNKFFVKQMPQIQEYARIDKLKLGKQKMQKIKYTLEIEQIANLNYLRRVQDNNLFYNKKNAAPMEHINKNKKSFHQEKASHQNLSISFLDIYDKKKLEVYEIRQKLGEINNSNSVNIFNHFKSQFKRDQHNIKKQRHISKQVKNAQKIRQEDNPFQFIDKIQAIEEERYVQKIWRKKGANIFKLITNDREIPNSKEIIDQYNFTYDSMISVNNQKKNGNIFRDLSVISRKFIMNNYKVQFQYKLSEADLNFNFAKLGFSDLMLIASGFLQHNTLTSYNNNFTQGNVKNNEMDSHISLDLINYGDQTNNVNTNHNIAEYDMTQKKGYIDVKYTKRQQNEHKLVQSYNRKIKEVIKQEDISRRNQIKDKKLVKDYKRIVDELLLKRLDYNKVRNEKEMNRLISKNKMSKNKIENINTRMLVDIITYKKQCDKKMNAGVVRSKSNHSKSKSPNDRSHLSKSPLRRQFWK